MGRPVALALASVSLLIPAAARTQTSPFMSEERLRSLVNEISGDRAFEHVRHLSHFHRTSGSRDYFAAAEYVRRAAEAAGLRDVQIIRQATEGGGWSCQSGEAWLLAPEEVKLASYGEVAVSVADHSRSTHVTAELVDVGRGMSDADYEKKDVAGKIVLASGSPAAVHRQAVWKRKALGAICFSAASLSDSDSTDQVAWGMLPHSARGVDGVRDGTPPTFAVMVSPRRGRWLQGLLARSSEPARVKVDIEATDPDRSEQGMVEGWIRGSEVKDQQIVLVAHLQEEMTSANDNGSGCGSLLEIARALNRLVDAKRIPSPRRDIRFWWVDEMASEPRYFRDNPAEPKRMLVCLNQDMVGARQGLGGRVQHVSRLPWSVAHPLEDVLESVVGLVRDRSASFLARLERRVAGNPVSEISAVKGSRDPYSVRMVPYFDLTDHHVFNAAPIRVPASTLTNWPDSFIHSTGDDLQVVDATQLERNAIVVAGAAWYFAGLSEEDVVPLAAHVAAQGRARASADLASAVAHVSGSADRGAAYRSARNLVRQSYRKEMAALAAIRPLDPKNRAGDLVSFLSSGLEESMERDLTALDRTWVVLTGQAPPKGESSKAEREMAQQVFMPVSDVGRFQDAVSKAQRVAGLHPLMQFEAVNFADGRRSAYEVYEAVSAEALSAGEWYYGRVDAADVWKVLEGAAKAGAFTVRAPK